MKGFARVHAPLLLLLTLGLGACADGDTDPLGPAADVEPPAFARGGNGGKPKGGPTTIRIAFSLEGAGGRIQTVNADGSGYSAIANTEGGTDPAWSPDRKKLAFAIPSGPEAGLYVIGANGRQRVRVFTGAAGGPAWSPDGTRIVFHASVAGGTHLFFVNADGTSLQQATAVGTVNSDPSWSPEGLRIVWFSNRSDGAGLWRMRADGTYRTRIRSCYYCASPVWSPVAGDERIAFSEYHDGTIASVNIAIIGSNGSNYQSIAYGTAHGVADLQPSWSPDATQLVFNSGMQGGGRDLYVVDADGSDVRRIAATAAHEAAPAWAAR